MSYGSPNSLDEVEAYYTHIRQGRKPSREEVEDLIQRYVAIGGRSPLLEISERQAKALEKKLNEDGLQARVYVGMKHWHPFIAEAMKRIYGDGVTSLVAIPLAPHYSAMSTGGYKAAVHKSVEELGARVNLRFIENWHLNPWLLSSWKKLIEDGLSKFSTGIDVFVLFTAHSLPQKFLQPRDPYRSKLLETSAELAEMLSIRKWDLAFQSASSTDERWLEPSIFEKLVEISKRGAEDVLVAPIGFVADHLEILYDIDVEASQVAQNIGLRLRRTNLPNDSPLFIGALASLVKQELGAS